MMRFFDVLRVGGARAQRGGEGEARGKTGTTCASGLNFMEISSWEKGQTKENRAASEHQLDRPEHDLREHDEQHQSDEVHRQKRHHAA
jgi:hypothetical protein